MKKHLLPCDGCCMSVKAGQREHKPLVQPYFEHLFLCIMCCKRDGNRWWSGNDSTLYSDYLHDEPSVTVAAVVSLMHDQNNASTADSSCWCQPDFQQKMRHEEAADEPVVSGTRRSFDASLAIISSLIIVCRQKQCLSMNLLTVSLPQSE